VNKGARVVIVSGASTDIGNSCAMYMAKKGFKVYAAWRNPEKYQRKADEFFDLLKMDSQDEDSIAKAVESVFTREGRIDALVTGSGPCISGAAEETSMAEARLQVESIFFDSFRETKAVLPYMRKQGHGHIVFLSCMAGWAGIPFHSAYSAGRFATEGFAEALRLELKSLEIKVSIVEPSVFRIGIEYPGVTEGAASMRSSYKEACERVTTGLMRRNASGNDIVGVARKVIKVIETAKPRLRYPVGGGFAGFAIRLKRPLSTRFVDGTLSRHFSA
jgi:NAD(P)-dependent dehydrogenase (short-subunit alcohol dehydrogenase family)